jgi:hypothetical protein
MSGHDSRRPSASIAETLVRLGWRINLVLKKDSLSASVRSLEYDYKVGLTKGRITQRVPGTNEFDRIQATPLDNFYYPLAEDLGHVQFFKKKQIYVPLCHYLKKGLCLKTHSPLSGCRGRSAGIPVIGRMCHHWLHA